jgi:selenocysteine-specific elongation factor
MRVIGTAGHVDHGKSTLIKRLTGIDPDRLAEEKARQMTIDLGFAWLNLPGGEIVGIVDVPGHRDFIENMLAGVGGIDAVLLIIAADEGVMPQTREHLAILDLLGINQGIIVLTKTDIVSDPAWLDLVEQDILDTILNTTLSEAEVVRVSAVSGQGVPDLLSRINTLLTDLPPRPDHSQPRLPVDRVFTMSGFGTVVTGTLLGGALHIGDEVEFQPAGLRGRIRNLQSYRQQVETAYPGSRVAVNVSGIERTAVRRGDVLAHPGYLRTTLLTDAHYRHLPDASRPLKHNTEVKVFAGTAEAAARIRLLNDDTIEPGAEGWLQLRLSEPLPLVREDRYILRYPSPPETIGGGVIASSQPGRRWKRFRPQVIARLQTLLEGTPGQRLAQTAEGKEPLKRSTLQNQVGYNNTDMDNAIREALAEGLLVEFPGESYLAASSYNSAIRTLIEILAAFHKAEPLRTGMSREELRSRMGIKNVTLTLLLESQDSVLAHGNLLRLNGHEIRFTKRQQTRIDELMQEMHAAPYSPPSYSEAVGSIGEDVLRALIDLGEIVQVHPDVIFLSDAYEEMVAGTLEIIETNGSIDAKSLRDRFATSRKYAIGLLEHLDTVGVTKRKGDIRVRANG